VVAPLPPSGEWRRAIAVDRAGVPRAVVLAFAPPSVIDDAGRLAAVLRDAEAAGRLHHPGAVPVLGTETVGDALAVVEPYRPGPSLRDLLDAAGRLPADVAARLAVDVCAALGRAHAIDVGDRRLAHGALDPARIVVGEDGAAVVGGFGTTGGGDVAGDVRAIAAVLHECLGGEPPGDPVRPLDAPGIPAGLAAAVDRGMGVGSGEPFPSAEAFARTVAGAGPVASHAAVASYAEAILPAGEGDRAILRGAVARALRGGDEVEEEVSADLIVEPTDPAMAGRRARPGESSPMLRPPSTRPGVDPAGIFRAPVIARGGPGLPIAVVVAVCAAAGFGIGLAGARFGLAGSPPAPAALEEPVSPPALPAVAIPAETASGAAAPRATTAAAPRRARSPAASPSRRARPAARTGLLDVTAPPDAEVFLDGRRVSRGSVRTEIPEGPHRIEVRRGEARVEERFTIAPGETWTYSVTPTP